MTKFEATITANFDDGRVEKTMHVVEGVNIFAAKKLVSRQWINFLYKRTDAYKLVKNSGISLKPKTN
ncbi:hypothetical protein [Subtercola sp. RTI3]|uniref:hypothetical protein n=1 Tax=Subtercola sp. RTI3 TaxID=3048639 RepID=UPI002B231489|nr:hypothetical protein [Subtercola sp. RTI3]MEA9985659.1 hypothetical protein [Subtercola sp. RTI3]